MTSTGYFPIEVSPESITASAPSITELATSLTSARDGVRPSIIDSIICVAIITGIRAALALRTKFFWIKGTPSAGTSTPKSPRATIKPLLWSIISSMFSSACGFSIFEIIGISKELYFLMSFLMASKSSLLRTKDSANQSTCCSIANIASFTSFSVKAGNDTSVFGRLTPLFDFNGPPWTTDAITSDLPSVDATSKINFPSSNKICSPTLTSFGKDW